MTDPLRVACIGMGWWSDVLADAIKRSSRHKIVACYSRNWRSSVMSVRSTCACRKSPPDILVMQPAQDRAAKNMSGMLNGARYVSLSETKSGHIGGGSSI